MHSKTGQDHFIYNSHYRVIFGLLMGAFNLNVSF